ncbi:MAG: hypothetical protein WD717_01755 [Nitrosarchaeum sp.]
MTNQKLVYQDSKNNESHLVFIKQVMKTELKKYNPTLKNILKIEQVLAKYKEFDTKKQLTDKINVTMRPPVLNVILKYLEKSNKILLNEDGSITWIYASPKAIKSWKKAVKL